MIYNPNVVTPTKARIEITTTSAPIILFNHMNDIDKFTEDYAHDMYSGNRPNKTFPYVKILFRSEPGIYTVSRRYEIRNFVGDYDTLYVRTYDTPRYYRNGGEYIAWGVWCAGDVWEL